MTRHRNHQELPTKWEDREKLRNKGQFWTPDWVARPMVRYAIESHSNLLFDPATGNGAFLEALGSLKPSRNEIRFYGTDIDPSLLDRPTYDNGLCQVERRDFIQNPPEQMFLSIVANPPYIRHHRLSPEIKMKLREIGVKNIGQSLDGRAGIHVYFLIQALSLLAPKGRLSFIMPADTCEGVFAQKLWKWITTNFCLEAVITFEPDATPFPNVDTNALVFMIRNATPKKFMHWIRCKRACTSDLLLLIESGFRRKVLKGIEIRKRDLAEALSTGLSRPPRTEMTKFTLSDFASVMRGIATGANEFFWLTAEKAEEIGIPKSLLMTAIGRTRDVQGDSVTDDDILRLNHDGRPTLLFSPDDRPMDQFPKNVQKYLKHAEEIGISNRALIKTRRPWYKMEQREIPPFLFAYLGRRNARFIRNHAGVIPLTGFLCVYPHPHLRDKIDELWRILSAQETISNLSFVGKSYGSGAIKVEPRNLERLPIPDHLVEILGCYPNKSDRKGHLLLFEAKSAYSTRKKKRPKASSVRGKPRR